MATLAMSDMDDAIPQAILDAYDLDIVSAELAPSGLINRTWIVGTTTGDRCVVQRLHAVFSAAVNRRIQHVTRILVSSKVPTPQLVPTKDGTPQVISDGVIWRVLSYMPGRSHLVVPNTKIAWEAGHMLARFHQVFVGRDYAEALPESNVHGLDARLEELSTTLERHQGHRHFAQISRLAARLFEAAADLPVTALGRRRIVHGDPKISNILFDESGVAVCMVDLDTVGRMPLVWELGDAFRSWCNPQGEDVENATFSLDLFSAAIAGYASVARAFIEPQEVSNIIPAVQTIYTELAARFCTDALREEYFAWNPARFASSSEHNLTRAHAQFNASTDLSSQREQASQLAAQAFARAP